MPELLQALQELVVVFIRLVQILIRLALSEIALLGWVVWWLWLVDWRQFWPALARGAWLPLLMLLALVSFLAWSLQISLILNWTPSLLTPLLTTALLVGSALLCGWLQSLFSWHPVEISFEPPTAPSHHTGLHASADH